MRKQSRRAAACLTAAAIVVVPAVVVARGEPPYETNIIGIQTLDAVGEVKTNSKTYTPVPGLTALPAQANSYDTVAALTVSVDWRGANAKLRLVEPESGDVVVRPRNVLVGGKGIASYTFMKPASAGSLQGYEVQWKRTGKKPAKAHSMSVHIVGQFT